MSENIFIALFKKESHIYTFRITAKSKNDAERKLSDFMDRRRKILSYYRIRPIGIIVEPHNLPTLEDAEEELVNTDVIRDIIT